MNIVVFTITCWSREGKSVYQDIEELNISTLYKFVPDQTHMNVVKKAFEDSGFEVESESEVGLSVSCEETKFEEFFKVKLEQKVIKAGVKGESFYYTCRKDIKSPICMKYIEKITFPKPLFVLDQVEKDMPELDYYHLKVPQDVNRIAKIASLLAYKDKRDIKVAMIDTGLYRHQYFISHNYRLNTIPAVHFFDKHMDERGHGTGMASVLLSVAPDVHFTMIKACDLNHSYPIAALQKASKLNVDLVNCSWGIMGNDPHLYLEIVNLLNKGTEIIFSCGNGSTDRKKSILQSIAHPEIISAGGCYPHQDGTIEISNISSSYESDVYKQRYAPDFCGVCGLKPFAQFILMPIQPGALYDEENGMRDGTDLDDGWFVSSGTSAAAAYLTGMGALLLQKGIVQKPRELKDFMKEASRKVEKGVSFMGHSFYDEVPGAGAGFLDGEGIANKLKEIETGNLMCTM